MNRPEVYNPVERFKKENPLKSCLPPQYWRLPDELLYSSNPFILGLKLRCLSMFNRFTNCTPEPFRQNANEFFEKYGNSREFNFFSHAMDYVWPHGKNIFIFCAELLGVEGAKSHLGGLDDDLIKEDYKPVFGNLITPTELSKEFQPRIDAYTFLKECSLFKRDREVLYAPSR